MPFHSRLIERSNGARSLKSQYEEEISRLGDEIHNLGLNEADVREAEIQVFKKSVSNAQKETQNKGKSTGKKFHLLNSFEMKILHI